MSSKGAKKSRTEELNSKEARRMANKLILGRDIEGQAVRSNTLVEFEFQGRVIFGKVIGKVKEEYKIEVHNDTTGDTVTMMIGCRRVRVIE